MGKKKLRKALKKAEKLQSELQSTLKELDMLINQARLLLQGSEEKRHKKMEDSWKQYHKYTLKQAKKAAAKAKARKEAEDLLLKKEEK